MTDYEIINSAEFLDSIKAVERLFSEMEKTQP